MQLKEKNSFLLYLPVLLLLAGCTREPAPASEAEQHVRDSVSRLHQRMSADSLRRTNPLLIVPPDSQYTGSYTDKWPNGITKYVGFFRFGKRHGQWMSFYENGEKWSEMHYDKGLRQGPNLTFFENGQPRYSGFYRNDMKDSVWTYYDSTGNVALKVLMKNDRIIRSIPSHESR